MLRSITLTNFTLLNTTLMKKLNYLFASVIILFLASCTPTPEEGIKYNDAIIEQQTMVMDKVNALDNAISTYVPSTMNKALNDLTSQLNTSIENVKKMKDFDRSPAFKDATIKYFN